jgi:hypothetical protein
MSAAPKPKRNTERQKRLAAVARAMKSEQDILAKRYQEMRLSLVAPFQKRAEEAEARAEKAEARAERVAAEVVYLQERLSSRYGLLDELAELRRRMELVERAHANLYNACLGAPQLNNEQSLDDKRQDAGQ